jgi:hypothetical protein
MAAFDAVMQSQAGTVAMTYDGVHPDTLARGSGARHRRADIAPGGLHGSESSRPRVC